MFTFNARRLSLAGLALLAFVPTVAVGAQAQSPAAPGQPQATPKINPMMLRKVAPPLNLPKLPANVVATVNGKPITRDEILSIVEMTHGKSEITELIRDAAVADEAKKLGVVVTEGEIAAAITKMQDSIVQGQMQNGTPMSYEQFAAQYGITPTFLRWSVYQDTLRRATFLKTLQKTIVPLAQQRKLEHILILTVTPGEAPAAQPTAAEQAKKDADAKVKIDGILADIKSGKITFEDAAKQYSEDKSNSAEGGMLGFAGRKTFVEAFENSAWKLTTPGEISEPVKSQFGWHLIKLVELGSAATPDEIKKYNADETQRIMQQVNDPQGRPMGSWLTSLVQSAKVVVNPSPVIVANAKSPLLQTNIVPGKKTASK